MPKKVHVFSDGISSKVLSVDGTVKLYLTLCLAYICIHTKEGGGSVQWINNTYRLCTNGDSLYYSLTKIKGLGFKSLQEFQTKGS